MSSFVFVEEWQAVEPGVRKTFLPVFWVEQRSEATSDQLTSFKNQVWLSASLSHRHKTM